MPTALVNNGYAPPQAVSDEEVQAFAMPRPLVGQTIVWHPRGLRNDQTLEIANVMRVGHAGLTIRTAHGKVMSNVKHADDPRLQRNAAQREEGSWDFTPYEQDMNARVQALREETSTQIKALDGLVRHLKGEVAKLTGKKQPTAKELVEQQEATTNEA